MITLLQYDSEADEVTIYDQGRRELTGDEKDNLMHALRHRSPWWLDLAAVVLVLIMAWVCLRGGGPTGAG